jgi:hypothetical protein
MATRQVSFKRNFPENSGSLCAIPVDIVTLLLNPPTNNDK